MNLRNNRIIYLLFTLAFVACSDGPTSAPINHFSLSTVSIIDKIVLSSSKFLDAELIEKNTYTLNFDKSKLFIEEKALDVSITYLTSSGCDVDVFIFNHKTLQWNQLGFSPTGAFCTAVFTKQSHLLSTFDLLIENFIDSEGKMLLKFSKHNYGIGGRIFEVSQDYFESSAPISKLGFTSTVMIKYADDSFWTFSYRDNLFHKQSLDGRRILSFKSQTGSVWAFSVDEQIIWYIDHEGKVFGVDNSTGVVKCQFQTTASSPKGLTTDGKELWIVFNPSPKSRLQSYDLLRSCETGVGVLLKDIEFSDTYVRGLDWDGSNLLLLDDKLKVVNTEGSLITAYTLDIFETHQAVWDGEAVMLFHHGPIFEASNESIVTRFLLN